MNDFVLEILGRKKCAKTTKMLQNDFGTRTPLKKLDNFISYKQQIFAKSTVSRKKLSFEINTAEDETRVHFVNASKHTKEQVKNPKLEIPIREEKRTKVKIPSIFIEHILSLGFNEKDADKLYENKDDWMGINSGGKLFCTNLGCKFVTTVSSDELFEHCRLKHQWQDHPCAESNCNFVAYNIHALRKHARFHSDNAVKNYQHQCRRANCTTSFYKLLLREFHENIHDNILIKCIFCPYTCVKPEQLVNHHRRHFNFRDYKCDECQRTFFTQGNLNMHLKTMHSDEKIKCPVCNY